MERRCSFWHGSSSGSREPKRRLADVQITNHMHAMAFAQSAFWQNNDDEGAFRDHFWRKTRRVASSIPFAEDLLAAYYCAFDYNTPLPVKTSLVGALAYFVLPADVIPDVLPILGFTDDAAVLATAINLVANYIRPEHRAAARDKLAEFSKQ
jgi:uncharacterized membrane protein YkvA (DUF1232 family)